MVIVAVSVTGRGFDSWKKEVEIIGRFFDTG